MGAFRVEHARVDFLGGRGKHCLGLPWRKQRVSAPETDAVINCL